MEGKLEMEKFLIASYGGEKWENWGNKKFCAKLCSIEFSFLGEIMDRRWSSVDVWSKKSNVNLIQLHARWNQKQKFQVGFRIFLKLF